MNILSPYVSNMLWSQLYGLGRSLNIPLEKPLEMLCVCVNSSLNLPALLLLLLLFVRKFDHCKFLPGFTTNLTP